MVCKALVERLQLGQRRSKPQQQGMAVICDWEQLLPKWQGDLGDGLRVMRAHD